MKEHGFQRGEVTRCITYFFSLKTYEILFKTQWEQKIIQRCVSLSSKNQVYWISLFHKKRNTFWSKEIVAKTTVHFA